MIWGKVRFCLDTEGRYADCIIGVDASSIPDGANIIAATMTGYELGTGFSTCIHEVRGLRGDHTEFYILPNDADKLTLKLLRLRQSL